MKIGILSSGGDCPGINATIRGVGKTAITHGNWHMGKFAHYSTEQQHDIQCGDNHRNGIKHK